MATAPATTAPAPTPPTFGNNRVLLYNVSPWNQYGFGVPNFADCVGTQSRPIAHLVDEIGRAQLNIMLSVDAMSWQPPSVNTAKRVAGMYNRVAAVLATRMKLESQARLEMGKAGQSPVIFQIHPVPYFTGPLVVNPWMAEWNDLVMIALTNMMQHSTNNVGLEITAQFASEVLPYFQSIAIKLGTELMGMDVGKLSTPGFQFNIQGNATATSDFATYAPLQQVPNLENLSGPGPLFSLPTKQDVVRLAEGIPANLIVPNLVQYPVGPLPGGVTLAGTPLLSSQALMAANATGPGNIGTAANTPADAIKANLAAAAAAAGTAPAAGAGASSGSSLPTVPPPTT